MKGTSLFGKIKEINGQYAIIEYPQYNNIEETEVLIPEKLTEGDKSQFTPKVGTDIIIDFTKEGFPYIVSTYYNDVNQKPFEDNVFGIQFEDGTVIKYNKTNKECSVSGSGITLNIIADNVNIQGNLNVYGTISGETVQNFTGTSIASIRTIFNAHTHAGFGVQPVPLIP